MSKSDLMHTRGKPSLSSQEVNKSMEIKEKEGARVDEGPSQNPRNPRGSAKMAAKRARRRKRKPEMTTVSAGVAAGGRETERTAMQTGDGLHEVERVVSSLDHMYRAGQIDPREYQAGCTYRTSAELLFSGYRCALDQEARGGGGMASPTMAQVEAAGRIVEASRLLGMLDGCVVALVAGEGLTIREAADRMLRGAKASEVEAKAVGGRLRQALRVLADAWYPEMAGTGSMSAMRRFDPKALDQRLGEVVRGGWAHATRSDVYRNG